MKIVLTLIGIILALLLVAVVRTLRLEKKETFFSLSDEEERIADYSGKLSKMIQYETVSHTDNPEVEKFRGFHKVLEELFPTVFEKLEKIEIDGNLMMHWKGRNPDLAPIILISHQDVVPAEGVWKYPPFSGTIADGKVWGRGAGDIKEGVLCFYQAAEELLREGYTPECDVYLGSSCTEEIGGDGAPKMANWFKEHGIKLFMLCDEGGGIVEDPVVGVKGNYAAIGIFEKGYGDLKFTARSRGGHSSTPPKNTPIVRLAKFEAEVEKHNPFKVQFSPAVESMFKNLAPYCTNFPLKMVMYNLWLFKPLVAKLLPSLSREAAAMLQTTAAFTMQKGSDGYNVIPQEAWVTANLRYIPHQSVEESNALMEKLAKKYDIETEVLRANGPSKSLNLEGEAFALTKKAIGSIFPGIGIMPYVVTGGTDSRFFGEVCDSCVRFSPINMSPAVMEAMHGIDEYVDCGTLPLGVDWYKEIIRLQETR